MSNEKLIRCDVVKVDTSLGLVFGRAIICKENGEPYVDSEGDHIPEDVMLEAATEFMMGDRVILEMHKGEPVGALVHSFPLTEEIADAMGILTDQTGWLVAARPAANVFEKYKSGKYTGFSIGGYASVEAP